MNQFNFDNPFIQLLSPFVNKKDTEFSLFYTFSIVIFVSKTLIKHTVRYLRDEPLFRPDFLSFFASARQYRI